MCGAALLGTGEALDRTCHVSLWFTHPLDISERRGSFGIVLAPSHARDLAAIDAFSLDHDRLEISGSSVDGRSLLYRGAVERFEGWAEPEY
jgi:hypothetical protein